ncbi:MAG: DUF2970 domain-containing protein [Pseudomonadales bacterium]|nr:DUF2970 domain-containing protein [Pseudomonadales bacterium]
MSNSAPQDKKPQNNKLSFLSMIQSVVAAIFGIQSEKNRQEDFKKGDASQFIVMGIVAVVILLIVMMFIVSSVLESAGR